MTTVSLLAPEVAARFHELQTLDDALAFRLARAAQPCPHCPPAGHCPDHAADHGLIAAYHRRHGAVLHEVLSGLDPAQVDQAMQALEGTPPTIIALSLAVDARLRELAAGGPVLTDTDLGPVLFTLENGLLIEHPLTPAAPARLGDQDTEAGPCR
jgi:hypothetical protein